ncbi:short chain dehydrogenase [Cobetia amphilecti]|uniref:short chain dehydrogenase n=1 Tax=Cobetia amphilecti TaxID=1055104 RepID=UPI00244A5255|nr:short chain dehydrogenase [Cobetia litoralis]MDH2421892.1 short chain dehydrogenase [Cobetia litoralis]
MKIVVIGATGTIGKAVSSALQEHEVIQVGLNNGDYQMNLESPESIRDLFASIGKVDAVVSTSGQIVFGAVNELSDADYAMTINNKLLGHLSLFKIAAQHLNTGGSFIVTTGYLAQHPIPGSAAISTVNAALDAFVKAAALEMGDTLRVNAVSPHFVTETMLAMGMPTDGGISAADTALAYRHLLEGDHNGISLDVRDFLASR